MSVTTAMVIDGTDGANGDEDRGSEDGDPTGDGNSGGGGGDEEDGFGFPKPTPARLYRQEF